MGKLAQAAKRVAAKRRAAKKNKIGERIHAVQKDIPWLKRFEVDEIMHGDPHLMLDYLHRCRNQLSGLEVAASLTIKDVNPDDRKYVATFVFTRTEEDMLRVEFDGIDMVSDAMGFQPEGGQDIQMPLAAAPQLALLNFRDFFQEIYKVVDMSFQALSKDEDWPNIYYVMTGDGQLGPLILPINSPEDKPRVHAQAKFNLELMNATRYVQVTEATVYQTEEGPRIDIMLFWGEDKTEGLFVGQCRIHRNGDKRELGELTVVDLKQEEGAYAVGTMAESLLPARH